MTRRPTHAPTLRLTTDQRPAIQVTLDADQAFRLVDYFAFVDYFAALPTYLPDPGQRRSAARAIQRIDAAMEAAQIDRSPLLPEEEFMVRDAIDRGQYGYVLPRFQGLHVRVSLAPEEALVLVRLWKLMAALGTLWHYVDEELEQAMIQAFIAVERAAWRAGFETDPADGDVAEAILAVARCGGFDAEAW